MKLIQYIVLLNVFVGTINMNAMDKTEKSKQRPVLKFPTPTARVHRHLVKDRERAKKAEKNSQPDLEMIATELEFLVMQTSASSTRKKELIQKANEAWLGASSTQKSDRETKVTFADQVQVRTIELAEDAEKQCSSIIDQSKANEELTQNE
jgi:hypothetical protein